MANENLNPHTFHEGFLKRLRATERELDRVEKRVRTLASKDEDIRQRKSELDSKITDRERAVSALVGVPAPPRGSGRVARLVLPRKQSRQQRFR